MSVLFAMSLRAFGGDLAAAPIISFQPRPGYQISAETQLAFDNLDVKHHQIPLNTGYSDDPFANKPLTAAHAEQVLDSKFLVFADSDQIILKEPASLCLPAGCDVGVRQVHQKNVGASGEGDPNYQYWQNLYSLLGVNKHTHVCTSIGNHRILSYWNSGLVAVRRKSGLFSSWAKNFHKVMQQGLKPRLKRFSDQTVLAATIAAESAEIFRLPDDYNYPIHRHIELPQAKRIGRLQDLTTIHYHKMFLYLKTNHPLDDFLKDDAISITLRKQMDRSGVYPESVEAREKYLRRIFAT